MIEKKIDALTTAIEKLTDTLAAHLTETNEPAKNVAIGYEEPTKEEQEAFSEEASNRNVTKPDDEKPKRTRAKKTKPVEKPVEKSVEDEDEDDGGDNTNPYTHERAKELALSLIRKDRNNKAKVKEITAEHGGKVITEVDPGLLESLIDDLEELAG